MPKSIYLFDGWRLDAGRRQLFSPAGLEIKLTSVEFDVLVYFCQHAQEIILREDLVPRIGGRPVSMDRAVDVRVARIRGKIEANPDTPVLIKTIRYRGYWFTPDVAVE